MDVRKKILIILKLFKTLKTKEKLAILSVFILAIGLLMPPLYMLVKNNFMRIPRAGGEFIEGLYQPVDTLNPLLAGKSSERSLVNLLYDRLLVDDGEGNFALELSKSITPVGNGLRYIVELKDNRVWSTGEKITSDDVLYSFEMLRKYGPGEVKNLFSNVDISRVDNFQIEFSLKVKDNYFLNKINQVYILPKSLWSRIGSDEWSSREEELLSVTSGPYKIAWRNKSEIVFVPNKLYRPKAYISKVTFKMYPNLQSATEAMKLRNVQAVSGLTYNTIGNTLSKRLHVERILLPRVVGVFFNSKEIGSFNANAYSDKIDRKKIRREVFEGYAEISPTLYSPSIRNILGRLEQIDISEFKKTSGENEKTIELVVPQNYFFQNIGEQLKKVMPLTIRTEDIETISTEIIPQKKYQAVLFGINYNLPPNLTPFFHETSPFNLINYSNPAINQVLQKLEIEDLKQKDKEQAFVDLEKEILKTGSTLFLVNPHYLYVMPNNVRGYHVRILRQPENRFDQIERWYMQTSMRWR
ncbi:MAG: AppA protein [Parcubacteria group bacterium GW2011_GWC1_41_7]|nr:MAG: AppA protein [Parcubacteria group bacterium GW2011_GWC1_41_7]